MSFPFQQQLNQQDCGPACLKMITGFYGRNISTEVIREKCHTGKVGTSLLALSKVGEDLGFKTIGAKVTFNQLQEQVSLPCIAFWSENHFVVLIKMKRNVVTVADPANGIITYSKTEFMEKWSTTFGGNGIKEGIILILEPSEFFFKGDNNINPKSYDLKIIFGYMWRYKKLFLQMFIGLLIGLFIQLLFPLLTQSLVDKGISNSDIAFIKIILIAQIVLIFSRVTADFIRGWLILHITVRVSIHILGDFFIKLMKLPIAYFDSHKIGDLMQRISDNTKIQTFLSSTNITTLFSLFTFIIFSVIIVTYDTTIFFVFIGFSIASVLWTSLFLPSRKKLNIAQFEVAGNSSSKTIQLVSGMQEIKLAGSQIQKRWEWERIQASSFMLMMKSLRLSQTQTTGHVLINETKNILITYLTAVAVVNGTITLGVMISIQYIIGQLNAPIDQFIAFIQSAQDAKLSLERINEIHSIKDENSLNSESFFNDDIEFKNVTFTYNPLLDKTPTLSKLNFKMSKNSTTAIVGMSGGGKTTIVKLLLGFYKPISGNITIGSQDINNINLEEWRKNIGMVMQDGYIFSDTILHNITIGDERPVMQRFKQAIEIANLKEFLDSLPKGHNTEIGIEGVGLSQGQKQRILIARAIYKNPSILLFDEATNSLDGNNEKEIMENLNSFLKEKTVLIVAHRLSTVVNADNIIVLKDGQIKEQGSHSELLSLRGEYYLLFKNQFN